MVTPWGRRLIALIFLRYKLYIIGILDFSVLYREKQRNQILIFVYVLSSQD